MDWSTILQGLGGPDASQLPLAVDEFAPPPVDTGGLGTGPGTMGRGALSPITPPSPANTPQMTLQPPAPVTANEGTMPLSPAGSGRGSRFGREGDMDVGAALTGGGAVPVPRGDPRKLAMQGGGGGGGPEGPISLGGPGGHTPLAGPGSPADQAKKAGLAQALKGVTAPKPPELQKISSPNAPRPTGTIQSGGLMQLLQALNAGGGGAPTRTLGQGIRG